MRISEFKRRTNKKDRETLERIDSRLKLDLAVRKVLQSREVINGIVGDIDERKNNAQRY